MLFGRAPLRNSLLLGKFVSSTRLVSSRRSVMPSLSYDKYMMYSASFGDRHTLEVGNDGLGAIDGCHVGAAIVSNTRPHVLRYEQSCRPAT